MVTRTRKGKVEVWIPRTRRRLIKGKSRMVGTGGHWRLRRPVGRKRKVDKKAVRLFAVRDQYGHILGYK